MTVWKRTCVALLITYGLCTQVFAQEQPERAQPLYPLAVLPFQERGREVEELGGKVSDLLLANLLAQPGIFVVERQDLKKIIEEQELSQAGLTDPQTAVQLGRLTGAKVLVGGSVFQVGDKLYVVAKLVGTETSRVAGASVKGKSSDELDGLIEQLARQVIAELRREGSELIARPITREDRIAAIGKSLGEAPRPTVWIEIGERHVGQPTVDPAAFTEFAMICRELGFEVIDRQQGTKSDARILLIGEGFSQFASKHGGLVSVKARLELKAVERESGRVLAIDRQITVQADSAELIASKTALQEAAAQIASRLLPAMMKPKGK